jgi:hypothetical protein
MRVTSPAAHPAYCSAIDGKIARGDRELFLFPVFDRSGEILSIVEIVKELEITESELRLAT